MKKLLALLLTGAMVFSLTACGSKEPAAAEPAPRLPPLWKTAIVKRIKTFAFTCAEEIL